MDRSECREAMRAWNAAGEEGYCGCALTSDCRLSVNCLRLRSVEMTRAWTDCPILTASCTLLRRSGVVRVGSLQGCADDGCKAAK